MAWIIVIGGIIVIILLVIGVIVSTSSEQTLMEQRLSQYLGEEKPASVEHEAESSALADWMSKRIERTSFGDRVSQSLARADMKFKVSEYLALIFIATVVLGGLAWLVGGRNIISLLIGAVVGFFALSFYVRQQQAKRLNKFNDQLSDMLSLMVNGLRAGYSTMQAMEAISKELPTPICDEFRRVVQEMQIGIPMEAALENLLRRIPSDDLDFVITAVNVQREVGGNLSEILDTISFTIRERVRIKGEIRVMTAQVRASGTLLSIIPMALALVLWFMNPGYLLSFFDGPSPLCGWAAIGLII